MKLNIKIEYDAEREEGETADDESPWGAQIRPSRRSFVFVEQSAEEVAPPDVRRMEGRYGRSIVSAAAIRRSQVERSVWTLLVEVADVDAQDVLELTATEDQ